MFDGSAMRKRDHFNIKDSLQRSAQGLLTQQWHYIPVPCTADNLANNEEFQAGSFMKQSVADQLFFNTQTQTK